MPLKIYFIDAFANQVFSGNPAAVCPLKQWPNSALLQKIAAENNLSETAFYVKVNNEFELRWFTPTTEVDLCGHATLAAAYVLYNFESYTENQIVFNSPRSGILTVTNNNELLTLNFPADNFTQVELTNEIIECFNIVPQHVFKGKTDYMMVFNNQTEVETLSPNFETIAKLLCRGVIVTAKGNTVNFVSRFFAPQSGINEDPVTGSAHTTLTPYWSKVFNKTELVAMQLSNRKGYLKCKNLNNRVEISGECKPYLIGEILIDL